MQQIIATILLIIISPILLLLYAIVRLTSAGPFVYKQTRVGKNMQPFTIYKIRTMVETADKMKKKLLKKNEADGPVFKIHNDPRYTNIGRFLSHVGLDEILQLLNIIKGEMVFVGPRPLPLAEAEKVPLKYRKRFSVKPGITSEWVIRGAHKLSFTKWMQLDVAYVKTRTWQSDILISLQTVKQISLWIVKKLLS